MPLIARPVHCRFKQSQGLQVRGYHRRTRVALCVVSPRELAAVDVLLWVWCVSVRPGFLLFFVAVFFLRTHTACYKYQASLPFISLLEAGCALYFTSL